MIKLLHTRQFVAQSQHHDVTLDQQQKHVHTKIENHTKIESMQTCGHGKSSNILTNHQLIQNFTSMIIFQNLMTQ